jgi:hypothetical protein
MEKFGSVLLSRYQNAGYNHDVERPLRDRGTEEKSPIASKEYKKGRWEGMLPGGK